MSTLETFAITVGETAGAIWQLLDEQGSLATTQIIKEIDAPRDQIMQSIGWLAREGKLTIREEGRRKFATLLD